MLAALAFACSRQASRAQDYPSRPITLVVPYAAGGGNDVMARIVAEKMSRSLGQQIVIENKGGAGGSIATRQVAKSRARRLHARPWRHRHARHQPDALSQCRLRSAQGFRAGRTDRDQRAGRAGQSAGRRRRSIPELIALAKREPGKLNYASAGIGSGIHLGAELFATHGGHQADAYSLQGLGARADRSDRRACGDLFLLAAARDRAGEGRQGARARRHRTEALADVSRICRRSPKPALPGYEAVLHYGIVAPAGTPRPIIEKLNAALKAALAEAGCARAHRGRRRRTARR